MGTRDDRVSRVRERASRNWSGSSLRAARHCSSARLRTGRARDGHGDLLADDVFCLADGPQVLDCLEFDEHLRFGDVLADVAFLAMDLERLARPDLAARFLEAYRAATDDDWPASLAHFYIAYRAHVRAKIAAIGGNGERAGLLLTLALDHLERGRVRLVLVGGPPATGKTTAARGIAEVTGWLVLRSDEVRKELAGLASSSDAAAPLDEGLYTSEWTERTYETLCERARGLLTSGRSVVLDASWGTQRWRVMATNVAVETSSELIALRCDAPVDLAMQRAKRRSVDHRDASDADAAIAAAGAARYKPWPEAHALDTTTQPTVVVRDARSHIGGT